MPAVAFFLVSAIFHYLGPSFAVLLFSRIDVAGVAWLRIASAGAVFAVWRRPWRALCDPRARSTIGVLGVVLAAMNLCFYLAIARLPLSTVGAIEFLGVLAPAAYGVRTGRNVAALMVTVVGVLVITQIRFAREPVGFVFAFANSVLFALYIILGHRVANDEAAIDQLGAAMLVATVAISPFGLRAALPAFSNVGLLGAGVAVGVCSSVIPYVTDQLAMARLRRETFALMLALLPVFAVVIGAVVLRQFPTLRDGLGIVLVATGVAIHRQEAS
jgi:inner membrane transporter RhtA